MNEIKSWLASNQDYISGVVLYDRHGSSRILKTIFGKGETTANRQKLVQELTALSEAAEEKIADVKQLKESGIYTGNDYDLLPAAIQALITQAKEMYKQLGALKAELNVHYRNALQFPDIRRKNEYMRLVRAGDIANTILDLDEEREALLFKIDFYKKEKRLPDDPLQLEQNLLEMTDGEIRARLLQLRPQISKHKNNPLRAVEYAAWCDEKSKLERRLDELV